MGDDRKSIRFRTAKHSFTLGYRRENDDSYEGRLRYSSQPLFQRSVPGESPAVMEDHGEEELSGATLKDLIRLAEDRIIKISGKILYREGDEEGDDE